jgi:hypothetical protein
LSTCCSFPRRTPGTGSMNGGATTMMIAPRMALGT